MDDVKRGLKIIDIFTNLREHVNKIGGDIGQSQGSVYENPTRETVACIGCWLADYFKTEVNVDPDDLDDYSDSYRYYDEGLMELENRLGIGCIRSFIRDSGLWHNDAGGDVFDIQDDAYTRTKPLTYYRIGLDEVCADWVQFGYNLVAKG